MRCPAVYLAYGCVDAAAEGDIEEIYINGPFVRAFARMYPGGIGDPGWAGQSVDYVVGGKVLVLIGNDEYPPGQGAAAFYPGDVVCAAGDDGFGIFAGHQPFLQGIGGEVAYEDGGAGAGDEHAGIVFEVGLGEGDLGGGGDRGAGG